MLTMTFLTAEMASNLIHSLNRNLVMKSRPGGGVLLVSEQEAQVIEHNPDPTAGE